MSARLNSWANVISTIVSVTPNLSLQTPRLQLFQSSCP